MVASPDLQPLPYSSSGPEEIPLEKYTQEKNASLQHLPSSLYPSTTHIEHEALIKGFTAITVAVSLVSIALVARLNVIRGRSLPPFRRRS